MDKETLKDMLIMGYFDDDDEEPEGVYEIRELEEAQDEAYWACVKAAMDCAQEDGILEEILRNYGPKDVLIVLEDEYPGCFE